MKKKGLIISTVVMVVVLIASLTTATYAWFSSTATARVGDIQMSATSSNKLRIGVLKDKVSTPNAVLADYASGNVVWNGSVWNGSDGLGPQVDFMTQVKGEGDTTTDEALVFALDKAVTLAKAGDHVENASGTTVTVNAGDFIKASGEGDKVEQINIGTADTPNMVNRYYETKKNADYFDATLFALPVNSTDVKQAYCQIRVTPTDTKIGMAAAITFRITVGNGTPITVNAYAGKTYGNMWGENLTAGVMDGNAWVYNVELMPWLTDSTAYYGNDISNGVSIKIEAWLEGTDDSCVSANAGSGGLISITFETSETGLTIYKSADEAADAIPGKAVPRT